jgi:hypothetical protein
MAIAKILETNKRNQQDAGKEVGVSAARIAQARTVLRYLPAAAEAYNRDPVRGTAGGSAGKYRSAPRRGGRGRFYYLRQVLAWRRRADVCRYFTRIARGFS